MDRGKFSYLGRPSRDREMKLAALLFFLGLALGIGGSIVWTYTGGKSTPNANINELRDRNDKLETITGELERRNQDLQAELDRERSRIAIERATLSRIGIIDSELEGTINRIDENNRQFREFLGLGQD